MRKIVFFTIALCLVASSAVMAKDMTGRFGLGFVNSAAPVGGIYWLNEKVGINAGIGFVSEDQGEESATDFSIDFGVPFVIYNTSDRVNFYIRPGLLFQSLDAGEDTDTRMLLSGSLMFEVFVTDDFSVSAAHGLAVEIYSPGAEGADSMTDFNTFGRNWTNFGFFYYLPAN